MIIGACGFGSTVSSAVTDYLSESDEFQVLDGIEFDWVAGVDGLIDLDYHLHNSHFRTIDSRCAIFRYKQRSKSLALHYWHSGKINPHVLENSVDRFLDSIIQVSWYGNQVGRYHGKIHSIVDMVAKRILSKIEKKLRIQSHSWPYEQIYLSINPDGFYEAAKRHVGDLLEAMGGDLSRPIVLDQPFSGNNPQASFSFFDDPYAIVVDRDPRDNYVFARTRLAGRNHFIPLDSVEDYVKYYRLLRENQPYKESNNRVLSIRFEDMVYQYDKTTQQIRNFLGLPEAPHPKSVFDPALSIANTQVWKRYPHFSEDIQYIERELPEYLFDFSGYEEPDKDAKMFFGKSPKHA